MSAPLTDAEVRKLAETNKHLDLRLLREWESMARVLPAVPTGAQYSLNRGLGERTVYHVGTRCSANR